MRVVNSLIFIGFVQIFAIVFLASMLCANTAYAGDVASTETGTPIGGVLTFVSAATGLLGFVLVLSNWQIFQAILYSFRVGCILLMVVAPITWALVDNTKFSIGLEVGGFIGFLALTLGFWRYFYPRNQ